MCLEMVLDTHFALPVRQPVPRGAARNATVDDEMGFEDGSSDYSRVFQTLVHDSLDQVIELNTRVCVGAAASVDSSRFVCIEFTGTEKLCSKRFGFLRGYIARRKYSLESNAVLETALNQCETIYYEIYPDCELVLMDILVVESLSLGLNIKAESWGTVLCQASAVLSGVVDFVAYPLPSTSITNARDIDMEELIHLSFCSNSLEQAGFQHFLQSSLYVKPICDDIPLLTLSSNRFRIPLKPLLDFIRRSSDESVGSALRRLALVGEMPRKLHDLSVGDTLMDEWGYVARVKSKRMHNVVLEWNGGWRDEVFSRDQLRQGLPRLFFSVNSESTGPSLRVLISEHNKQLWKRREASLGHEC